MEIKELINKDGEYITFIMKDENLNYRTISIKLETEDSLNICEGYYNSKFFVKAFQGENFQEALSLAENFINEVQSKLYSDEELKIRNRFTKAPRESFIQYLNGEKLFLKP